jgi:hypothetical protein
MSKDQQIVRPKEFAKTSFKQERQNLWGLCLFCTEAKLIFRLKNLCLDRNFQFLRLHND